MTDSIKFSCMYCMKFILCLHIAVKLHAPVRDTQSQHFQNIIWLYFPWVQLSPFPSSVYCSSVCFTTCSWYSSLLTLCFVFVLYYYFNLFCCAVLLFYHFLPPIFFSFFFFCVKKNKSHMACQTVDNKCLGML